ncbi:hypothetical protein ON010_g1915 [Phytophthora cinnamomi]|nr:hypothetical protein ON010_g1915 [Phytophthora cinnamomi]
MAWYLKLDNNTKLNDTFCPWILGLEKGIPVELERDIDTMVHCRRIENGDEATNGLALQRHRVQFEQERGPVEC